MKKIIYSLSILFLASCANNSKTEETTTNNEASSELTEVSDDTTDKKFVWDFKSPKKYTYIFDQTSNAEHSTHKGAEAEKIFISANGKLSIRAKEQNLADLSFTDMESKMVNSITADTSVNKTPPMVLQDLKPDGSIEGPSDSEILLRLIMPLPLEEINEGESNKVPIKFPINANGSRLFTKGFNTLEFTGYETYLGRKCAVLKGVINVSDLNVPEEVKGEYKCSITGTATYYFDVKHHLYVGAEVNTETMVLMDIDEENGELGLYYNTKNIDTYSLKLEKIEDIVFKSDSTSQE